MVVWEESAKSFSYVWYNWIWKERLSVIDFKWLVSNKSLPWVSKIKSAGDREPDAEKQRNLYSTLMYLTLPPKYKLDDNHKTNIDTFEIFFFRKS